MEVDLGIIAEFGLLGAFVSGLLLMNKIRENDLRHLTEHLSKIESKLDDLYKLMAERL